MVFLQIKHDDKVEILFLQSSLDVQDVAQICSIKILDLSERKAFQFTIQPVKQDIVTIFLGTSLSRLLLHVLWSQQLGGNSQPVLPVDIRISKMNLLVSSR